MGIEDNYVSLETMYGKIFLCIVSSADAGCNTVDAVEAKVLAAMLMDAVEAIEAGSKFDAKIHLRSGVDK